MSRTSRIEYMGRAELANVHRALNQLMLDGPRVPGWGICYNLNMLLRAHGVDGYSFIRENAHTWERCVFLPDGKVDPYCVPRTGGSRWEGEERALRMELLSHLNSRVEAALAVANTAPSKLYRPSHGGYPTPALAG